MKNLVALIIIFITSYTSYEQKEDLPEQKYIKAITNIEWTPERHRSSRALKFNYAN